MKHARETGGCQRNDRGVRRSCYAACLHDPIRKSFRIGHQRHRARCRSRHSSGDRDCFSAASVALTFLISTMTERSGLPRRLSLHTLIPVNARTSIVSAEIKSNVLRDTDGRSERHTLVQLKTAPCTDRRCEATCALCEKQLCKVRGRCKSAYPIGGR